MGILDTPGLLKTRADKRYITRPEGRVIATRSNRLVNGRLTNASGTGYTFKARVTFPYAAGQPVLWFANIYNSSYGENPNTNPLIVRALLVKADGTVFQCTFGHKPTLYLPGYTQTAAPAAPTLTAGTAGALTASAAYYVVTTYVTPTGETVASAATQITVGAATPSITVQAPAAVANATGYNVYVGLAAGASTGPFYLMASRGFGENAVIANNPTNVLTLPPTANTTAGAPASAASGTPTLLVPSDVIPADLLAGENAYVVTFVNTPAAGQFIPVGTALWGQTQGTGEGYASGDATANHAGIPTTTNTSCYGPSFITGLPDNPELPCIAIKGDSIPEGTGDPLLGPYDPGYVVRGLNNQFPYAWVAKGSELTSDFLNLSGGYNQRRLVRDIAVSHCNVSLSNYGTNDVGAGRTAAQIKANLLLHWAADKRRGLRVYQSTLTPRTKSLDGWHTAGGGNGTTTGQFFYENASYGMLHAQEDVRQAINTWLRAPASAGAGNSALFDANGTLDGIVDTGLTVEVNSDGSVITISATTGALTGLGGGYWYAGGAAVVTGTATSGTTAAVTDTSKAYTANQYSGYMIRITGGTAAGQVAQIISNTATVMTLNNVFTVAPDATSTYELYLGPTQEGIHPCLQSHVRMAVPVASWAAALNT